MRLFVGLGNPGEKYQNTRHNLGVMVIDKIVTAPKYYFKLKAKITKIDGDIFATLDTYMNTSGPAVKKIMKFFKIQPKNLFVIHDDLDLGVGEWKKQFNRSAAGHKGVQSIIDTLGTQAFNRYRIGIGRPANNVSTEDYVLQPFSPAESVIIDQVIKKIISDFYSVRN